MKLCVVVTQWQWCILWCGYNKKVYKGSNIAGGSGGMVPHKNLHALRLLLVVSETGTTNTSSEHTLSAAEGLL